MPAAHLQAPPSQAAQYSWTWMPTFDPGAMRTALQDGCVEHVQMSSGVFAGAVAQAASVSLRTNWGRYNLPLQARGDLCGDMLTLAMLMTGDGDWRVFGKPVASGDILLLPEGGELLINLPARARWVALQVPRARLEAAGIALQGLSEVSAWRMSAMDDEHLCRSGLVELSDMLMPADPGNSRVGLDIGFAHEQVLAALLAEWERRRVARGAGVGEQLSLGERSRILRRIDTYLGSVPDATVRIDDLCRAACTSLSTLERVFREVYGMTPHRYLALRRLARARNDLLNGAGGESVTEVALRWGFVHLGRFSQEYARLYRELPSQTRSRAAPLAA